ncbi:MAG: N(4)-(beta-N-acetylglucosaminyl)-L-asparaginase [Saprospiraceae bacterium]|nr:N(4)-(beta-N-acetylglucosaminyl)-L-asparaginase [Saprospiraceae bacterium]
MLSLFSFRKAPLSKYSINDYRQLRNKPTTMFSRRKFLSNSTLASLTVLFGASQTSCAQSDDEKVQNLSSNGSNKPLVISTWNHGIAANVAAWEILENGGSALDAVEKGVRVTEGDPKISSVGYGGTPDRDGAVTLDACIMDSMGNCGSVCFLEHIKHPISVARKVMEETPHVILAGEGALQFALSQGFEKEDLLTESSKKAWEKWTEKKNYAPIINVENHDTIGMLAMDENNNISGACTTSGLGYKMKGRVGDSPIIGAGLFVDNEVGGAVATGLGEAVLKSVGSFLIVELMRNGMTPQEACDEAINRIIKKQGYKDFQIGYLAINKNGEVGASSIHKGFNYALHTRDENRLIDSKYLATD